MYLPQTPLDQNVSPLFSIVVPSWNNLELLQCCIDSVKKNSAHPHQIIVHINEGSDGSLNWVREQKIEYTHTPENSGVCYSVNLAAMKARHEFIVFLNDDMYCLPDWDVRLFEKIKEIGHDAFMLSGTMIEPVESGNPSCVVANFGMGPNTLDEQGLIHHRTKIKHPNWHGSTWPPTVVHKRWWHAVGGYSTELFPGMSSDNDFAMKMWQAGCRIFTGVGNSYVYHFMSRSTGKVKKNNGRKQFLFKWGITQATLSKYYLRIGTPVVNDVLEPPKLTNALRWQMFRCRLKRLFNW